MTDKGIRQNNPSASFMHSGAIRVAVLMTAVFLFAVGCQTTYYAVWEKMGKEKRHLLKDNVEQVREDQAEASEQFASVVERIKAMYGFDGGELEDVYEKLSEDYRACEERAEAVRDRIDKVERIAADLFKEWESEIASIENAKLQSKSRASLQDTRSRFSRLQRSMARAEASMDPVLNNLQDYVLYLKHNLNAQAVSSLRKEVADIETEVSSLIADMNRSIKEADAFVKTM
jgi:dsDNA-specific endonuclease/ATPase MutS2